MSWADLLIDSCTVQRYASGVADGYGVPAKTWTDNLVDRPCRLVSVSGREVTVGALVVIAEYTLFIGGDADIIEQDRVTIDGVLYEVLLVQGRSDSIGRHHKECLLRTVR